MKYLFALFLSAALTVSAIAAPLSVPKGTALLGPIPQSAGPLDLSKVPYIIHIHPQGVTIQSVEATVTLTWEELDAYREIYRKQRGGAI